ncbi:CCN family member 1 [Atheta coriaria]|uniref:CCN family member 1 n=1 Tax=Dalotia coriaria TaxID=877792 RepID=UPI0031F37061
MLWNTALTFACLMEITLTDSARLFKGREIRSRRFIFHQDKCLLPCTCPTKDICEECEVCPRQANEPCSDDRPCDLTKGLTCTYLHDGDTEGICRTRTTDEYPCIVDHQTYQHGETFSPDCRTQCACQNGTYGCSSLCPQEHISPTCMHPRLVDVPGQCCREWMCDSQAVEQPPSCQPSFTKWTECSADCGTGLSKRRSNLNGRCEKTIETRLCQTRNCESMQALETDRRHHLRKGHECKATHRLSNGVHFRFGPCVSRKRFRPKYCGKCSISGILCRPLLSTTVRVDFVCDVPSDAEVGASTSDLLPEFMELGEDMWTDDAPTQYNGGTEISASVQWVLKCSCDNFDGELPKNGNDHKADKKQMINEAHEKKSHRVVLHRVHRTAGDIP